jgi:hypothetical protein
MRPYLKKKKKNHKKKAGEVAQGIVRDQAPVPQKKPM